MPSDLEVFLRRCGQAALATASSQVVTEGVDAFLDALDRGHPVDADPRLVPVVDELLDLELAAPAEAFGPIARQLRWTSSPRGDDPDGRQIALAPLNNHFELGEVVAGFLVAGAGCVYPEHNHEPQELYLTMAGRGSWRFGGHGGYQDVEPGSTFYNPPGVIHSARAEPDRPVLALYVLWP